MTDELRIETRFELHARVGRGASGDVFRATDRETGAVVAVKRLVPAEDDGQARDRFAREVRLLASIDDPHVVHYVVLRTFSGPQQATWALLDRATGAPRLRL